MKLYAYFLMAYFSLKESLTYWKDYISFIIFSVLGLVLQISAWYALYSSVDFAPVMGRSYETMITYYLIMQIVRNFTSADGIAGTLEQRMSTGEIATDMLRPAAPRGILIARAWGEKLYYFIPSILIFVGSVLVVGGIQLPASPGVFAAFCVSLCLGYLINLMFGPVRDSGSPVAAALLASSHLPRPSLPGCRLCADADLPGQHQSR